MRLIVSILVLLCLSLPAMAEDSASIQRLMQFAANNESFDKNVSVQAKTLFLRQFPGCTNVEQVVRQLPEALGDLTFPGALPSNRYPAPSNGLWIEHVKVRACGRVRQVNLLSAGQQDGSVVMLALLPGDTQADPAIQRDAERVGATSITKVDASCSDTPVINNTRHLSFRDAAGNLTASDAGQGWFEEWSYRFCQKDAAVQMAFIPNGTGAYDVKARPVGVMTAPQTPTAKPTPQ